MADNTLIQFFQAGGRLCRTDQLKFEARLQEQPLGAVHPEEAIFLLDMLSIGLLKLEKGDIILGDTPLELIPMETPSSASAEIVDMAELRNKS